MARAPRSLAAALLLSAAFIVITLLIGCGSTSSKASAASSGTSGTNSSGNNASGTGSGSGSAGTNSSGGTTASGGGSGATGTTGSSGGGSGSGGSTSGGASDLVYIGSINLSQIAGFTISAAGTVTPLPGSPYAAPSMGVTADPQGRFLYSTNQTSLNVFSVGADGSLSKASSTAPPKDQFGGAVMTDNTGANLYAALAAFDANSYASYAVGGNGSLSLLGTTTTNMFVGWYLTFAKDNVHAYTHGCQMTGQVVIEYTRNNDGTLTESSRNAASYSDNTGTWYCPDSISASPSANLVAITYGGPPSKVGLYSVSASGALTQVGSVQDMGPAAGTVYDSAFDPSGNYLAASCDGGIQFYQVSSSGLTPVGGLQGTVNAVAQIGFDGHGHLLGLPADVSRDGPAPVFYVFNYSNGAITPPVTTPLPFRPLHFAVMR